MIKYERVHLTYPNGVRALSDIDLEFQKGEISFLVGPTGCGKSSLLKLVYLDKFPTRGRVFVMGKDTFDYPAHQAPYLRRKVGVVFQDFKLLTNKTVRENIAFVMEVIGASRLEMGRKIPQVLERVGLADKAAAFPSALSGGEVQRVAIARAIVNDPLILLADEPTGNLDPDTSWDIMQHLLKIQASGTTVVVASHNVEIVDAIQKRVIRIEKGKVVYQ